MQKGNSKHFEQLINFKRRDITSSEGADMAPMALEIKD